MDRRLPNHNFHNEYLRNYQVSVQCRCNLNITSFSFFWERIRLSLNTIQTAKRVIKMPWPKSPNITANRKGNVMIVYGAMNKPKKDKDKVENNSQHTTLLSHSKTNVKWLILKLLVRWTPWENLPWQDLPPSQSSDGIWATTSISSKTQEMKLCL